MTRDGRGGVGSRGHSGHRTRSRQTAGGADNSPMEPGGKNRLKKVTFRFGIKVIQTQIRQRRAAIDLRICIARGIRVNGWNRLLLSWQLAINRLRTSRIRVSGLFRKKKIGESDNGSIFYESPILTL